MCPRVLRLAWRVHHASALKDVESKLVLSEEESIYLLLYGDPQKKVKRDEVLHDKFMLDGRYGVFSRYGIYIFPWEEVPLSCLRLTQEITQASTTRLYKSCVNKS
jgi:hypothetical protein